MFREHAPEYATLLGATAWARLRLPVIRFVMAGMLVCAAVVVWTATAGLKAKHCLDGRLAVQQDFGWRGATITEEGCEVATTAGEVILVPIHGPPFEAGVAGALGFVALAVVVLVLLVRRRQARFDVG